VSSEAVAGYLFAMLCMPVADPARQRDPAALLVTDQCGLCIVQCAEPLGFVSRQLAQPDGGKRTMWVALSRYGNAHSNRPGGRR